MRIYEPHGTAEYECLIACDDDDYEVLFALDGQPRGSTWRPIRVQRVRGDKHWGFKASDFPWLGLSLLVLRRRAVDALADVLSANGELLPLIDTKGVELYAFNARAANALDEARSTLQRIPNTNKIMRFIRPVFFPDAITGRDLFTLPMRGSPTFVSERFVDRVRSAGLVGLEFKLVWEDGQPNQ